MQTAGDWKQGFGRRLGYFALGLGIGLVLLAIIQQARQQAAMATPTKATSTAPGPANVMPPATTPTKPSTTPAAPTSAAAPAPVR